MKVVENVRLKPWLRGRAAAALPDQVPIRMPHGICNPGGDVLEFFLIPAGCGHGRGDAVRAEDQARGSSARIGYARQGVGHACRAGLEKQRVPTERRQFVNLRSLISHVVSRGLDVLDVLPASRIGWVS